mgnify:CR=1 FL=1
MIRKNPNVDVIKDVLQLSIAAYPASNFLKSMLFHYEERGGLSKKQLQDLHAKALKVTTIPVGKLATLEAVILKKPTRYKSPLPVATGQFIDEILAKYPHHKMILFLKTKYETSEQLPSPETAEIERLHKLLILKAK